MKHGVDVNATQNENFSLFGISLREGDFEFCNILLSDEKFDPLLQGKGVNKYGENMLHMLVRALHHNKEEAVQVFSKMTEKVRFSLFEGFCFWLI